MDMVRFRVMWWFKNLGKGLEDSVTILLLNIAERCVDRKRVKLPSNKKWIPPDSESLKFKVDGAVRPASSHVGIGGVLHNSRGEVLCSFSEYIGVQDIMTAEVLAIARACQLCRSRQELKGKKIVFVRDSKVGVSWINCNGVGNWKLLHTIMEIRNLLGEMGQTQVEFGSRDYNEAADILAKKGVDGELNIKEEPAVTVARFLNGLRFELKRVVSIHNPETLEDAYSKALKAEKYLRPYPSRRLLGDIRQTRPIPPEGSQSFNYRVVNTSTLNAPFDSRPSIPRDRTGLPSPMHPHNPNIECHHCHANGYIASRCPQRTLTIAQEYDDYYPPDPTDEVVEPIEDIHYLDLEADLDDREFEGQLHMMRCIFSKPVSADTWKRMNVFHTFIPCKGKIYKLVIDGGSTMNIVSNAAVTRFHLNPEPHPHPFRVAWVDKTSLPITHRCLVSLSLGSYSETIYYGILPMEVAHILLGRPWLYDLDVKSFGRANTHMFTHQDKTITLQPAKSKDSFSPQTNKLVVDNPSPTVSPKHNLNILGPREFMRHSH
ncbi:hypothetical protein LWI29_017097 [Acer saccharum]|uniref:RNase H type-1 domain-containing protein n=1 Tax=Acer saccharum TaxID=4024 RepID=A0AA39S0E1_ACESA|nr:hypothetical protein LWI29_017097 [Acer saccharum]